MKAEAIGVRILRRRVIIVRLQLKRAEQENNSTLIKKYQTQLDELESTIKDLGYKGTPENWDD